MHYKTLSAWIFAFLLLLVGILILWPSSTLAGVSMILLPLLLVAQAVIILRARERPREDLPEDQWYEKE